VKILHALLLGMLSLTINANALEFFDTWEQPAGTVSQLTVPMRGGALYLAGKRAAGETQYVEFTIDARAFFQAYPNDHVYVLLDATLSGGLFGRTGRGITIRADGIRFENFAYGAEVSGVRAVPFSTSAVRIIAHANAGYVAWFVMNGNQVMLTESLALPDETMWADKSLIIMGATSDANPTRVPASVEIRDVKIGKFR